MSHGDAVTAAPPGFTVVATSAGADVAAFEDAARGLAGCNSTRGSAQPAWAGNFGAFPVRGGGVPTLLDHGKRHRRAGCANQGADRRQAGGVRFVGRRGFRGRGRSCSARWAINSRAYSSTTASCAKAKPSRWSVISWRPPAYGSRVVDAVDRARNRRLGFTGEFRVAMSRGRPGRGDRSIAQVARGFGCGVPQFRRACCLKIADRDEGGKSGQALFPTRPGAGCHPGRGRLLGPAWALLIFPARHPAHGQGVS